MDKKQKQEGNVFDIKRFAVHDGPGKNVFHIHILHTGKKRMRQKNISIGSLCRATSIPSFSEPTENARQTVCPLGSLVI